MTVRIIVSEVRKCGKKKEGGIYIDSESDGPGVLPVWISLDPPIPCADKFHRSAIIVDGAAILARKPEEEWLEGASKRRAEKQEADQWAIERFGMTVTKRLNTGDCDGMDNITEALEHLLKTVSFNAVVVQYAKALVIKEAHEIPRVTEHYANFVRSIQLFVGTNQAKHLVSASAAVWQMADGLPPRKRKEIVPTLVRTMVMLNLSKDAAALHTAYS